MFTILNLPPLALIFKQYHLSDLLRLFKSQLKLFFRHNLFSIPKMI